MTKRKAPEDKLKVGAPSKLTPAMQLDVIKDVQAGLYVESICEAHGVDVTTFYRWLKARPEFRQAVKMAEVELQQHCLAAIGTGAPGWQGSAWIMERRFPKLWGMRVKQAVMEREYELHQRLKDGLSPDLYLEVMRVLSGNGEAGADEAGQVEPAQLPAA